MNDVKTQPRPAIFIDKQFFESKLDLLKHILTGFADRNISTAVVVPSGCDIEEFTGKMTEIIAHPAFKLPFLWGYNRKILIDNLNSFKPTVLHCLSHSKLGLVQSLSNDLYLPYVVNIGSARDKVKFKDNRCSTIIVPSKKIKKKVAAKKSKHSKKLKHINYATYVNDDVVCFDTKHVTSILMVADFDDHFKFEPSLSAFRHLAIDGYEFVLIIIGQGRAEQKIRQIIKSFGLLHIVNIVPHISPLRQVFAQSDIFVQPFATDYYNHNLLEAMSVGMAVAGCEGCCEDILIKNETGVIFDPNDEMSIYSSLQELFDKRQQTRQFAQNAQQYLKQNHSVSVMVDSLVDVYQQTGVE